MTLGETFTCPRCNNPIDPTNWHLGHNDTRDDWTGPECPRCNIAASNRPQAG